MQNRWRICPLVIALLAAVFATRSVQTQSASCFVSTINGNIQGVDNGSSCTFLGIPFAAPPIASLRWKPPSLRCPGRRRR